MLYFDSSTVVCMLSGEERTEEILSWFSELEPTDLCMSDWNITEFHSAMSFKRRTGQLTAEQRQNAERLFVAYLKDYFQVLSLSSADFRRAASIAGRDDINIRASDALHLAVAEAHGATICTLDKKMNQAAGAIGVDCLIP